jgi:two-component system CheB/CheR fusion protein
MKIRSLLLLLALGVALPVLAFAVLVSSILLHEERQAVEKGAVERARAMMSAVDAKLRGDIEAAQALSASQALMSDDLRGFQHEAILALDVQPNWLDVYVSAPDGDVSMVALNAMPGPSLERDRAAVLQVAHSGEPAVGDVSQPDASGIPVRVPVFRDGKLIYVITTLVRPVSFDVLVQSQDLPEGWTSGIVDGNGNFVARVPFQPAGRPASKQYREQSARGREGWYRGLTVEGRDTFTAFARSSVDNWTIGLAVPADLVLAATWRTGWLVAVSALAAMAIAFALAVRMGRRIVRPMVSLSQLAHAVGGGEEAIELPRAHVREIDGVAIALKDAGDAVRSSQKRIAGELDAMRRLHDFVTRLNDCHDMGTALQEIMQATIAIGGAEMGNVQLFDAAQNGLEIVAQRGFGPDFLEHFKLVHLDDGSACSQAVRRGGTVAIEDVTKDPLYEPHRATAEKAGYRAVQSTPILSSSGELLGAVSTHFREPKTFSEHELRILDLYGRQAADVIERIRNEQAVRDGTAQRQLALDAARLGWWHFDPRQKVSTWDRRYREIFDTADDSGHLGTILSGLHPEDVASVRTALARALDPFDPRPYSVQYRARRSDGTLRWVQAHGLATFEGSGASRHATSLVGTVEDITESKQVADLAQQATIDALAAAEANAKFRAFFDQGSTFAGVVALDGTLLEANRLSLEACGYTREQVIGRKFWDGGWWSPSPALVQMIREGVREAAAGTLFRRETTYFVADGTQRVVDLMLAPVKDESGRVLFIAPTGTDITERTRAEDALRASEQRFRSLVSILADVLWITDANGEFSAPQPSWEAYTGQTWDEYKSFGWLDALPADDRADALQTWKRACDSRALFASRGRMWHAASQRYRYFAARAIPLLNEDGSVREWVGCCTDTDEVVRSAEALKEADRRKDEFLATLAHELRNPLAPIRNSIEILRKGDGANGANAARALELMQRQVSQMVRLIDDLFDASRISRGKVELRKSRIEIVELARHAAEAAQPLFDAMNQRLTLDLSSKAIFVNADSARLAQVVGNLLNNASKFTPRGGHVSLTVECVSPQASSDPGASGGGSGHDRALIRVRDDGVGIAPDQLPRIFGMFTQVDTSLERSQSGLGIGLTLVKDLVEMHGGSVEARSGGLGMGSEFTVRLPVEGESRQAVPAPDAEATLPVTGRRILVVDDNRDAATSLATLLELTGHEAHVAYDGAEAIDKATTLRPHVVLLDIGLPEINGYEAARLIRKEPWGKSMTLVALTGWGQEEDLAKSRDAGFDRHLVKPVEIDTLTRLLAEFVAE